MADKTAKIPSPFDPAALRCDQSSTEGVAVKKLVTVIPVRKPGRQEFVRVNPDPNYRLTGAAIIELKDDNSEVYIVTSAIVSDLAGEYRIATIFTALTRFGVLFLWPVYGPGPDGKHNPWHRSAGIAAEVAMRDWVRVTSNRALGGYEPTVAMANIPDPVWPELTFTEMLEIAFVGKLVDRPDHPLVLRLRGMV